MEEFYKSKKPEEITFNHTDEEINELKNKAILEEEESKNVSDKLFTNHQMPKIEKKYWVYYKYLLYLNILILTLFIVLTNKKWY